MSVYRITRRWVDGKLAGSPLVDWNWLLLVAVVPAFGVMLVGNWWWWPAGMFLAAWTTFVGWRAWRLYKTGLVDSDASDLPPQA